MFFRLTRLSPYVTGALSLHRHLACMHVVSDLAAAGPTLLPVFRSRKSCRDLPVFSFPLEVFPHTNKAQPAWWNKEEAAFVWGEQPVSQYVRVGVCVRVHYWPQLTVCCMQIYSWARNSGCSGLLFAPKPNVPWEQAYSVSHSQNKVACCLPLINRYNAYLVVLVSDFYRPC